MVVYLSHTLGGASPVNLAEFVARGDHSANAYDWLRFLVDMTDWSIVMPWQAYVIALGELQRPRSFADQLQILKRCDAIVFVGGDLTPHMEHEERVATEHGIAVINLTDLGYYPPNVDRIATLLDARLDDALERVTRNLTNPKRSAPRI